MKIIQACKYTPPARDAMGAERIVERLVKGLDQLGHDVKLVTDERDEFDADLVHFHGWDLDAYSKIGKPWVTTIHGYQLHQYASEAYRKKNVVAVSQFAARNIGAMHYVWNCADPEEFTFKAKKENYFVWIAGTDWSESKGLFTTIELCNRLKVKLKIAGTGKVQETIDKIKDKCNDHIEYLGAVNGAEKVELLQNAKAMVLFTRLPDACPVSVSESLMCGTPVIGSRNGAMPEIVLNNVTGFNCNLVSECIRAMSTVERLSNKTCRDYAAKHFSIESCAKGYLNIYNRVINAGKFEKAASAF